MFLNRLYAQCMRMKAFGKMSAIRDSIKLLRDFDNLPSYGSFETD